MQYKNDQVKILANIHTGRETYVDLKDIVLNPNEKSEIKLGDYLASLSKESKDNKKEIKKLKKAIAGLIEATSRLNLK